MLGTRKQYEATFKAKVALEALKGEAKGIFHRAI
jgi:hypothetical protein